MVAVAIGSPAALAQTTVTVPPPASTGGLYVGYVGTGVPVAEASAYLRPGTAVLPPAPGNATVVSVETPGAEAAGRGTVDRDDVVTGWDFVGLSAMALGAVGAIGLLMGRRRSF
jgi:hypothetical protein